MRMAVKRACEVRGAHHLAQLTALLDGVSDRVHDVCQRAASAHLGTNCGGEQLDV